MASEWTTVAIPFIAGLDTKSATAVVSPEKLSVLENGVFTKQGNVAKRSGYEAVPQYAVAGEVDGTPRGLLSLNDELALATATGLYTRTGGLWDRRGSYLPAVCSVDEIAYANVNQYAADCAVVNGVLAVVWKYDIDSMWFQLYDATTRLPLCAVTALGNLGNSPGALAVGNTIFLTYANSATDSVDARVIRTSDLAGSMATTTTVVLASDLDGVDLLYTTATGGGSGFVAFFSDGTATLLAGIVMNKFNTAGVITGSTQVSLQVPRLCPEVAYSADSDHIGVCWVNDADDAVMYRRYAQATMAALEITQNASMGTVPTRSGLIPVPQDEFGSDFYVFCENPNLALHNTTVDIKRPGAAASITIRHSHVVSSGFQLSEQGCIILGHDSATGLQNGYYLYNTAGECCGAFEPATAADYQGGLHGLPHFSEGRMALHFARALSVDAYQAQYAQQGIKVLQFDDTQPLSAAEYSNSTYLSGCQLWAFDGDQPYEGGFHMFPDMTTAQPTALDTGGALETSKQYNYRVYYEWYNARGERVRSLPMQRSFNTALANVFASGTGRTQLVIPTLRHTLKSATHGRQAEVSIVVYRTVANASNVFFRVSSSDPAATGNNGYVANSFGADTVTFVDAMSDTDPTSATDLTTHERDYFSEAELFNAPIPGAAMLYATAERLYLAGGGVTRGTVLPSKLFRYGEQAQFATELEVRPTSDSITALGAVNEVVVAFTRDAVYGIGGAGPDNNGGSGEFQPQRITSDVGCTSAASVVMIPKGLLFKSAKGIYGLGQSFDVEYVGAAVEAFNANAVTAAHVLPDTNQVVFLCTGGNTLMFDYQYGQWGTFTNHQGSSAAVFGTDYAYLRTDGSVFIRAVDAATDGGAAYSMRVRTGRFRPADCQGYWRLRRFGILGEYHSPHDLRVSIFYNRELHARSVRTVAVNDVINSTLWGTDDTWGDSDYWGGSGGEPDYRWTMRPAVQKCSEVAFEFEDILTAAPGAAYELTELVLEWAPKGGIDRAPNPRRGYGTT